MWFLGFGWWLIVGFEFAVGVVGLVLFVVLKFDVIWVWVLCWFWVWVGTIAWDWWLDVCVCGVGDWFVFRVGFVCLIWCDWLCGNWLGLPT